MGDHGVHSHAAPVAPPPPPPPPAVTGAYAAADPKYHGVGDYPKREI